MKSVFFLLCLLSFAIVAQGLSDQQFVPPELKKQYDQYLKEKQSPMLSREIPSYETPPIFDDGDTLLFEKREFEEEERVPREVEAVSFFDHIIIEGDTVQSIKKAAPEDLEFFGSDFFKKRSNKITSHAPVSGQYVVGNGDNLIVSLWGSVDYEYNLTVDRDGKVFIPKAGTVSVSGLSMTAVQNAIRKTLERIYSDFEVDVTLGKVQGSTVFVVGEAASPGTYSFPGMAHVIEALVVSGGPNEFGSYRNIQVYRSGRIAGTFDMYDFLLDGSSDGGVQLANGDIVQIRRLGPTVKIRGRVRRPAIYEIDDEVSIGDVLDLAGGVLPDAHIEAAIIDRIDGGVHMIVTKDFSDSTDLAEPLFDSDDISVFPIKMYRQNMVILKGQVVQPGSYGLHDSMRISDLLMNGDQLLPDAYRRRADLVRLLPDRTKEIISIDMDSILAGKHEDLLLKNEDLIVVYSIWDIKDKEFVSIYGAVRSPGKFELFKKMRVSDLVFESGGFTPSAFAEKAEIARVNPGEPTKIINIDLIEAMKSPGEEDDVELWPYDILFIRDVPEWKLQDVVSVTGDVKFPGKYALESQNERLSDVIERAGGFTEDAFVAGAVFIRPRLSEEIKNRNLESIVQQTQEAVLDSEGNIVMAPFLFLYQTDQISRIIIDMERVMENKLEDDVILEGGDSINIPKTPTGVNILGMVASNGTIRWIRGKRISYYIDRAGGLTRNADAGGIRLVKANGKVVKASLRTGSIEQGDAIIVPQRLKKKSDWMSVLSEAVTIVGGLATSLYILLNI